MIFARSHEEVRSEWTQYMGLPQGAPSQDTPRIGVNENGEPEAADITARCFIYNEDIEQVVISKDILQWESRPMSERIKDHIDTLPRAFPIAIVHHLPSLIWL